MSLREEKKRRTRNEIQHSALALFRERGFEATRVRDVIEHAQVSEGTFFNYFAGKDGLASDWAHGEIAAQFARVERAQARNLRQQMRELVRELSAAVSADAEFLRGIWLRARLVSPVARPEARRLVERAQHRGELRGDVPAAEIAELLRAAIASTLADWLLHEERPGAQPLASRLARAVDLVLDGSRKRNERVRAPASARLA